MMHQITLEELGIIPKQEKQRGLEYKKNYAFPCGGCICNHCANSVECIDVCIGEAEFGCFDGDECRRYDSGISSKDKWKEACGHFKITDAYAKIVRKRFELR